MRALTVAAAFALVLVAPLLQGGGCSNPPVPVNVSVEVLDEALDVIDTARPLDVGVEVTLTTANPRDQIPSTTFAVENVVNGTNGALITVTEMVEPCSIAGPGGTIRLLIDGVVELEAPLELDDAETDPVTPHPNAIECAFNGVARSLRVHPTANGANLALERL